jgi:hypothetical protein
VHFLLLLYLLCCTLVQYVLNGNHNLFSSNVPPFSCVTPASKLEVFGVETEIITLCDFKTCENYNKARQMDNLVLSHL